MRVSCRCQPVDRILCLAALGLTLPSLALAQFGGPAAVRFTEAIDLRIRGSIELTGSVESRRASTVASEVAGVVVELSAREGDTVRVGQPLAKLRQRNILLRFQASQGELEEARARLKLATASRQRAEDLHAEEVLSVQQLDDALSEFEAWKGRVAQLEADLARLEDDLARTTIRAPFSGVVVAEHTAQGEWLSAGGAVAEMVDVTTLELGLEVPEQYFSGLAVGETVEIVFDALAGAQVEGRVRAVIPSADPRARTFPVKVDIPNDAGAIGVGMLGRAQLPVGESRSAVAVPKDALVSQGRNQMIFVIDAENTARAIPVETGGSVGGWVAVTGAVSAGDQVIVRGNERLQPGAEVVGEPIEYELP
jgi:RND family efflux transporter MFP subunit